MAIHADGPAPYTSPSAILKIIEGYRERGLTTPFSISVLERAGVSGGLAPRTLQALKLLGLIDDDGNPTAEFEELRKASSDDYKARLQAVLRAAYEEVFQFTDPQEDSPDKVRDAFRVYTPRGQQPRMVTLFMGLCEEAGIVTGKPKKTRQPRPKTAASPRPANKTIPKASSKKPEPRPEFAPSPPPSTGQHPFIRGLLQSLPEAGTEWDPEDRAKWTNAALAVFDLIYELPKNKGGDQSD
jgi:hypothetical protein